MNTFWRMVVALALLALARASAGGPGGLHLHGIDNIGKRHQCQGNKRSPEIDHRYRSYV